MNNWLRVCGWGLRLGFQDFQNFWKNWRIWVMTHVLRATTSAATLVLLGRLLGSDEQLYFLLIGQIVIVGPQYVGWTVAAFTWDRMFVGTYPMLVAAPTSLVPAMIGRTSIWLINGVVTSLITFLILGPIFGLSVPMVGLLLAPAIIAVVCVSYYGLSFFIGSVVNWVPQLRNIAHNSVTTVLTAICGAVVPLAFWPSWVERIAGVLPVTHGLRSIRLVMAGVVNEDVAWGIAFEVLIGLIWLALGIMTLDRTNHMARRNGSLDLI